jgi:CheY-specific phosphatase CheX
MGSAIFASFESAVLDIFRENNISVRGISPAANPGEKLQVVSTMGLSGDLRGNIVFGCSLESAHAIVNSLFKASDITPQDKNFGDLQKATIGEFANQITGRALMHLSRSSVDCNMTPPTVITGDRVTSDLCAAHEKYSSRVEGSFGSLVLHVGIKESKKV